MIEIRVDRARFDRAMRALRDGLSGRERRKMMSEIAAGMQRIAKRKIQTQGDGKWAPLSEWTRFRTGRRKALITLIPYIRRSSTGDEAKIWFDMPDGEAGWDIRQHIKGWRIKAVKGKKMAVPSANGKYRVFYNRKATRVSARNFWPTKAEAYKLAADEGSAYLRRLEQKVKSS